MRKHCVLAAVLLAVCAVSAFAQNKIGFVVDDVTCGDSQQLVLGVKNTFDVSFYVDKASTGQFPLSHEMIPVVYKLQDDDTYEVFDTVNAFNIDEATNGKNPASNAKVEKGKDFTTSFDYTFNEVGTYTFGFEIWHGTEQKNVQQIGQLIGGPFTVDAPEAAKIELTDENGIANANFKTTLNFKNFDDKSVNDLTVTLFGQDEAKTEVVLALGSDKGTIQLKIYDEVVSVGVKLERDDVAKSVKIQFSYGNDNTAVNVNTGLAAGVDFEVSAENMESCSGTLEPKFPGEGQL